jgi:hypothetical protein
MDCKTRKKSPAMLLVVASLFCFGVGIASAQNPPDKGQMKGNMGSMPGMTGNMPMDGACPMMGGAGGAQHQQMTKLMDQVSKSAAALEKESDSTVLKKKVAEHAALVKKLDTQFQQCATACGGMMKAPDAKGTK